MKFMGLKYQVKDFPNVMLVDIDEFFEKLKDHF